MTALLALKKKLFKRDKKEMKKKLYKKKKKDNKFIKKVIKIEKQLKKENKHNIVNLKIVH